MKIPVDLKNRILKILAGVSVAFGGFFAAHDFFEVEKIVEKISAIEVCDCRESKITRAKVTRVIDGDTVELANGDKIRIKGLDTPENTKKVEPYGPSATKMARKLLENKFVELQITENEVCDRFGRFLRVIFYENSAGKKINFAETMVEKGLAQVYAADEFKFKKELCAAEKRARAKKLKMWSTKKIREFFDEKRTGKMTCAKYFEQN